MKYKKTVSLIISLVLIGIVSVPGFAGKTATVYAGDINALPGDAVFIPIQIKDNPGLMGLRISVTYDSKVLTPRVVSRGIVTEKGLFEDSIGNSEESNFDILWNNTSEIKENGTLAVISFSCSQKAESNSEIILSYSQEDTFNEKYESVPLSCENFEIVFDGSAETTERTDKRDVTPEDIVLAVETVQGDPQVTPTTSVMDSVNSLLSQITGNPEAYFSSPDEITESYVEAVSDTFSNNILSYTEPENVVEIVQNALELTGADTIENVPEDVRVDFINNIESALKEIVPDMKDISDYISQEDEISVLSKLYDNANKDIENDKSFVARVSNSISNKTKLYVVCSLIGLIAILLLFLKLFKYLKHKKQI